MNSSSYGLASQRLPVEGEMWNMTTMPFFPPTDEFQTLVFWSSVPRRQSRWTWRHEYSCYGNTTCHTYFLIISGTRTIYANPSPPPTYLQRLPNYIIVWPWAAMFPCMGLEWPPYKELLKLVLEEVAWFRHFNSSFHSYKSLLRRRQIYK